MEDDSGCSPEEINVMTYTAELPIGVQTKLPRNQIFGILNVQQFGTAAQWGWPGMAYMGELLFGDPDWSVIPIKNSDHYDIGYAPLESNPTRVPSILNYQN